MVQHSLFDELETQAGVAATPTPRRGVQPTPGERAFWEDWKASALPGFVVPYCRALAASRLHRSCWWVDGLAATGRRAGASAGSAITDATETLAAASFTLRALRVEAHPLKNQELQAAPAGSSPASNGHKPRKTPAADRAPAQEIASASRGELPEMMGTSAAVLLLNPFATPPLTAEDLLPLCQRRANTELLLTISAAQVERWAEQSLADSGTGATAALTALLRSDSWKAAWAGEGTGARAAGERGDPFGERPLREPGSRTLGFASRAAARRRPAPVAEGTLAGKVARTLDLLQGLLKPHFLYVCLAPLGDAPTPRHFLLFASRQYSGLVLMNDFLCAERARLARERETRALQGDWFAKRRQKARAAAWAALKEELHALGLARRARLWPDLKPALTLAHFGQFSTADYDAALLELLREGRVSCRWSPAPVETPDAPPAERVPGQQDFLEFIEAKTRPVWRRS